MAQTTDWNTLIPEAQQQISTPAEQTLHSANCGLIIHRVGRIRNEFRAEAREFARVLQTQFNRALGAAATTFLYEELFGEDERFHWLVHMKAPNDYAGFIRASDHDTGVRQTVQEDRLEKKGGGNWERMFEEGSFRERVLVPQHGIVRVADKNSFADLFVPPAKFQTTTPPDQILHTANASFIIQRTAQVHFAHREEGRHFGHEWQEYVNRKLRGDVTILLYEETWGQQDRIHWMMHFRTLEDYAKLLAIANDDEDYRHLFTKNRASQKGGPTWAQMFVDGSIRDTVLVPHNKGMGTTLR